jgi:rubrerythrin
VTGVGVPSAPPNIAPRTVSEDTMNSGHWKTADLPWDRFEAGKVDPETLKVIKAASLVEYGGGKYGHYLCNVFADDPAFQQAATHWAGEEIQHGEALGRYAELVDPAFDLREAYARFEAGYGFDTEAARSVRGSRSGELIARCIVETGTSSYYTAIADATEEPLLKAIFRHIASDELRHYKLFYTHLKRYLHREELSRFERMRIVVGRMRESEDDELSYAYYAANAPADAIYRRKEYARAYMIRAYRFYQPAHIDRVVAMAFKVCGLRPHSVWHGMAARAAWWAVNRRVQSAAKTAT